MHRLLRTSIVALHAVALLFSLLISGASAQVGGLGFPGLGLGHQGTGALVFTSTDIKTSGSLGFVTSGSFTGVNFGAASTDRIIQVGTRVAQNASTMTMTIGGIPATLAVADTINNSAAIWYANVPSGTSGTVSWANSGAGVDVIAITVAQIHGQSGGGAAAPTTTGLFATNMAQPVGPLSVTVPTWANTTPANGDNAIADGSENTWK